jgi:hypothetical protein
MYCSVTEDKEMGGEGLAYYRRRHIAAKSMSSCPSVCRHVTASVPLKRFCWNFILGTFINICRESPDLNRLGKKYRELHVKNWAGLRFIVAGVINPLNAELNPICHLLILLGDLTFMGPCIVSISNEIQRCTVYLYLETALHVSGGISTHHQERIQLYLQHLVFVTLLLLSAAIVEELEPVWVCCGWRTLSGRVLHDQTAHRQVHWIQIQRAYDHIHNTDIWRSVQLKRGRH